MTVRTVGRPETHIYLREDIKIASAGTVISDENNQSSVTLEKQYSVLMERS